MAKTLTIPQKEDLRNRIAELYLRGYGIGRMAAEISRTAEYSVTAPTVSAHLKAVLKTWFDNRIKDVDQRINTELLRLNEVEYEAWQAWQRSCKAKTKKSTKRKGTPYIKQEDGKEYVKQGSVTNMEQTEETPGDPRFLDLITRCVEARLNWLTKGMDWNEKPKAANGNVTNNTVLIMAQQPHYVPDKIKQLTSAMLSTALDKQT